MRIASAISQNPDASTAVGELLSTLSPPITPGAVDLALLFLTAHYDGELPAILESLHSSFPNALVTGCTAEGTIGMNLELERIPSMSLLVASLPGVDIRPFHVLQNHIESAESALDWERIVAVAPESQPKFILFADPFRADIHAFLESMNTWFPGAPLVGGIASAATSPGENRLILRDEIVHEGIVGIALTGNLEIDTVVSQGCRPIGKPFVVTRGEQNLVRELGGKAALEQLQSVLSGLSEDDESLARQALFLGRAIDEYKDRFQRGDFLIHNIIGADRKSGAIGIAGHARVGSTVQFHVRDAASADEDLHALLKPHADKGVTGALLFGCNGRGTRMWPTPNHDVSVLREVLGNIPVAGFFCGGEFGPIGRKNFIHGFTASIALLRPGTSDSV
ncbi:MAG: FIST N-terminal domain-containing protein [Planctomycetota bacterium]